MDTQQQKQFKILLIGDACTDVYVIGKCNRLSSEAPVPVFLRKMKGYRDGMSANVFQNLSNISDAIIDYRSNKKSLIKKIRFIDARSKQQIMRYDIENSIIPLDVDKLPDKQYDCVIISDYNKGFLLEESIKKLIKKYSKCKIFVDTKKSDLSIFKGCTVKINEDEDRRAINKAGIDLIVTLGVMGAKTNGNTYPTDQVDVYDVCGAGDVFLSTLATRWLETRDLDRSIKTANKCASFSVTKMGTYHLKREEYENLRV